jgi:hypothetical protein
MQQLARRHSQKIIDENQKLRSELEAKMNDLDVRSKQLDELAAKSDYDRRNLEQEKQKVCDFFHLFIFPSLKEWKELISLVSY